ncbi:MAG: response regulator [Deltaproteobacteria bacterium HGW-Deltaproteobacteria-19]|jgi:CheY-like chemotaxis protein|nr:MAG: response regulator [Deltaproteobacteria bacterium HGW-Deltaproteobacteria-19]
MKQKKILIVDDEVEILILLKEAFESAGYVVWTAENAEDALNILQTQSIMVMFLDLKLPGMSGMELCKMIRINNQIGIVNALTGYSNFFGLLECRAAGFDDFFTKPVSLKVVLKAAEEAFERLERWNFEQYDL